MVGVGEAEVELDWLSVGEPVGFAEHPETRSAITAAVATKEETADLLKDIVRD